MLRTSSRDAIGVHREMLLEAVCRRFITAPLSFLPWALRFIIANTMHSSLPYKRFQMRNDKLGSLTFREGLHRPRLWKYNSKNSARRYPSFLSLGLWEFVRREGVFVSPFFVFLTPWNSHNNDGQFIKSTKKQNKGMPICSDGLNRWNNKSVGSDHKLLRPSGDGLCYNA